MIIRQRLVCIVAMLLSNPLAATQPESASKPDFQIVESVPEATSFGEPGVPRTQTVWLQMINDARHSIDIAAFYIADRPGSALSPVLDALVTRAGAGIPTTHTGGSNVSEGQPEQR